MFLESFSENPEENFRRFAAARFHVGRKAAVVHQVAQAAAENKIERLFSLLTLNRKKQFVTLEKVLDSNSNCSDCH
jgi:hypothetical protein